MRKITFFPREISYIGISFIYHKKKMEKLTNELIILKGNRYGHGEAYKEKSMRLFCA